MLNVLVTESGGSAYLDDAISMCGREVHRNALSNFPDDKLVRVMAGGNVVDVVDVAQRDDLCGLAGEQVRDWQCLRCCDPNMALGNPHGDRDAHGMRMSHCHFLEVVTDLGFQAHYNRRMRNSGI